MGNIGSNSGRKELTDIGNMNKKTLFYQIILNDFLFQEIKELLNNTNIGSNNLLIVSRTFQKLKKEHFYWKLNKKYSRCYYTSSLYRERITLLMNTKSQLSLLFRERITLLMTMKIQLSLIMNTCSEVVDVAILADIDIVRTQLA
jgi:hypothetical protein